MYSREVLEHFEHPRNVGDVSDADASAELENPACGDILRLSLKLHEDRIVEVRFRARGCVPAIACGSKLTQLIGNRTILEASAVGRTQLVNSLGGLPDASMHASHLAIDTLAAALKQLKEK
jgi:nitrogen fixation NifU-like protein